MWAKLACIALIGWSVSRGAKTQLSRFRAIRAWHLAPRIWKPGRVNVHIASPPLGGPSLPNWMWVSKRSPIVESPLGPADPGWPIRPEIPHCRDCVTWRRGPGWTRKSPTFIPDRRQHPKTGFRVTGRELRFCRFGVHSWRGKHGLGFLSNARQIADGRGDDAFFSFRPSGSFLYLYPVLSPVISRRY